MTDVTQAGVLSPEVAVAPPRSIPRPGYLFGPAFDFLTLGGGSIIICAALAVIFPRGIPSAWQAVLITLLMTIINQPHFAHSYQMFYRNFRAKAFGASYPRALRLRYLIAGILVPLLLIGFLAGAALSGSARVLAYGANAMFFLVGWHYVKQGYGILIVDSVQKRIMFPDSAKTIFRLNGYAAWFAAWLGLNHAISTRNDYIGLVYFSIPLPAWVYQSAVAVLAVTSVATAVVLAQRWRETKGQLPWNGVVAYLTTLYLWVIFVRINPLVLAVVPTFHSLQYLAVVWRYQLNAGGAGRGRACAIRAFPVSCRRNGAASPFSSRSAFCSAFSDFTASRARSMRFCPTTSTCSGPALFLFSFYIFINIHHYFLDNVMWRRGNPDVQQYIFARPANRTR